MLQRLTYHCTYATFARGNLGEHTKETEAIEYHEELSL